jgi:Apea-like HEPN
LGMTRSLLALLRPALISVWIDFTVEVDEFETAHEDDRGHRMGVFSEWDKIYSIARGMKKGDFFILSKNDIQVSNRLAKIFPTALKSQTFIQLMGLYYRAYEEKVYYFKFLLLFMIIESLIDGDDKTGVVYKIRRMCATLVGYNIEDCKDIFAKVGECYNLRSKLVHRANFNIERSYVLYILSLVCELLIFLAISELDKKEIFNTSTRLGFGQRNTVIKNKAFKKYSTLLVNEINFIGPLKTPKSKSAETSETRKTKK